MDMDEANPDRVLEREKTAAAVLKDTLRSQTDDDVALADTIEGATDLHEAIREVLLLIEEDDILLTGLDARIEQMQARRDRIRKRREHRRTAIEQAMVIGEIKKREYDIATISMRPGAASVHVIDESRIPSMFWEPQPPRLDRRKLLDFLKLKNTVAGAELSNAAPSLTIRKA